MTDTRSCTCHPDDAPVSCQKGYALSVCKARAELVEKVARAICREKCAFMGEPPCFVVLDGSPFSFPPETCCEPGCVAEASAAIDIVLKEAARVAETVTFPPEAGMSVTEVAIIRGGKKAAENIAAAIRAMKGKD